jgi:hypothetical protein
MNAMAKALKVLQDMVVREREIHMQLSLELRKAHKEKWVELREVAKAMKT